MTDTLKPVMRAKPLVCPWCQGRQSLVVDARTEERLALRDQLNYSGEGYWRKRECCLCGGTFTTEEFVTGAADPPPNALTNQTHQRP